MKKDVVAGLGEIGLPMQKLLSRTIPVVGYDKKTKLINTKKLIPLLLKNQNPLIKITKKITINIEFRMLDFCSSTYFEGRFVI